MESESEGCDEREKQRHRGHVMTDRSVVVTSLALRREESPRPRKADRL